jgi:hypothetical protein
MRLPSAHWAGGTWPVPLTGWTGRSAGEFDAAIQLDRTGGDELRWPDAG